MEQTARKTIGDRRALIVHADGTIESEYWSGSILKRKKLSHRISNNGYVTVSTRIGGKSHTFTIHRLIAECFIDNPEHKSQINHINGIKTDNNLSNLEWCSQSENIQHALRNGLYSTKPVIRVSLATGETTMFGSVKGAAREVGVSHDMIGQYCRGEKRQPIGYLWRFADIEAARAEKGEGGQ